MKSAPPKWYSPLLPSAKARSFPALALTCSPNHLYIKFVFLPKAFQCCGGQRVFYSGLRLRIVTFYVSWFPLCRLYSFIFIHLYGLSIWEKMMAKWKHNCDWLVKSFHRSETSVRLKDVPGQRESVGARLRLLQAVSAPSAERCNSVSHRHLGHTSSQQQRL